MRFPQQAGSVQQTDATWGLVLVCSRFTKCPYVTKFHKMVVTRPLRLNQSLLFSVDIQIGVHNRAGDFNFLLAFLRQINLKAQNFFSDFDVRICYMMHILKSRIFAKILVIFQGIQKNIFFNLTSNFANYLLLSFFNN